MVSMVNSNSGTNSYLCAASHISLNQEANLGFGNMTSPLMPPCSDLSPWGISPGTPMTCRVKLGLPLAAKCLERKMTSSTLIPHPFVNLASSSSSIRKRSPNHQSQTSPHSCCHTLPPSTASRCDQPPRASRASPWMVDAMSGSDTMSSVTIIHSESVTHLQHSQPIPS